MNHFAAEIRADDPDEVQSGGNFVVENGVRFAGRHLLIDLWDGENLDDLENVGLALREAVTATGATLLKIDLHHFTPDGGVSGVALLAESHISIHTWPEEGYAAIDVFMCGDFNPSLVLPVVQRRFGTVNTRAAEHKRGVAR
jgi:S-adenosylmethionine decarboxylase